MGLLEQPEDPQVVGPLEILEGRGGHGVSLTAVRLIRSGALPPELNLALDEALLRSGRETLRLYAWDPPGLSLGFFQRAAGIPCPPGFRLVRRPTGGGAIAHTGELTITWVGARRHVEEVYGEINLVRS